MSETHAQSVRVEVSGVVTSTKTLLIELSETFAWKNVCGLVEVEHFSNNTFVDCCPHALQVLSRKNSRMKLPRKAAKP